MAAHVVTAEELEQEVDVAPEDREAYELARMRHSCAHLMAEAVQELFPDVKFAIGPAIENGFYYDMDLPRPLTPDGLEAIEALMRRHREAGEEFQREVVSRDEALELFSDNPYKVE